MGRLLYAEFVDSYSTSALPAPPPLAEGFVLCPLFQCQGCPAPQLPWMQSVLQMAFQHAYREFTPPRLPRLSLN